jgi:hypothetical protein
MIVRSWKVRVDRQRILGVVILVTAILWWRSYLRHDAIIILRTAHDWSYFSSYSLISEVGSFGFVKTVDLYNTYATKASVDSYSIHYWSYDAGVDRDHREYTRKPMYGAAGPRVLFDGFALVVQHAGASGKPKSNPPIKSVTLGDSFGGRYLLVLIPYWVPVTGLCMWWLVLLRLGKKAHPANTNICAKCGYDLRASHDRCPECGTEIDERMKDEG